MKWILLSLTALILFPSAGIADAKDKGTYCHLFANCPGGYECDLGWDCWCNVHNGEGCRPCRWSYSPPDTCGQGTNKGETWQKGETWIIKIDPSQEGPIHHWVGDIEYIIELPGK